MPARCNSSLQNRLVEYEAVTSSKEKLATGTKVRVVGGGRQHARSRAAAATVAGENPESSERIQKSEDEIHGLDFGISHLNFDIRTSDIRTYARDMPCSIPSSSPQELRQPVGLVMSIGVIILFAVLIFFSFVILLVKQYKRCPKNRVLVIYGRTGKGQASTTVHGGAAFVWPLIQDYAYLSLEPIQIEVPLRGALSRKTFA